MTPVEIEAARERMLLELKIARADAIEAYAWVERELCSAFAYLAGTDDRVAGTIFFRLNNARTRRVMLNKMMRLKHGDDRRLFFNSLIKRLNEVDDTRNQIVHWIMIVNVYNHNGQFVGVDSHLAPPDFWSWDENTPNLKAPDLLDFSARCRVIALAISQLVGRYRGRIPADALPDITLEPLAFPLPDNHPLLPT